LTTSNSHYDAIMQLYNRDIISGYSDGTFRPTKHVTRGQAAKMLASILGLELSNVKNPKFKDVPLKNSNYPYIAALVELGVMSGYKDGTFRPNEVITRNQMAKIIVRGFQFGEAKELTHTFEDVTSKNANRFYIQTLLNLNITQGTSAITYSPSKAVTRGQLASFLIRAEKANVHGASVKEVTKVEQVSGKTYVYLNGVKHTVHTNLRDMLNIRNTEILMGAHVEGTIIGTEIRAVNKITFNAIGAANNVLTFDGNDSTFRGIVEITGNHLRFTNWNVTGQVKIAPVQHEVFSNVISPLQMKTIAALKLASDNIDWGTITPPSVTQPGANDGLVDIPSDNKPTLPKLKNIEHDIQFVNVTIRALQITANRTKVRSNLDLAHVTVSGYVREFELHFDVGELYLESEDNVTFYGVSDIEKLYKNTYKSVNLYADSITQLIAVDNAFGWIDLGDYYYVDKVIIPPNRLPHEIFNDFLNDSDKVGNIEDPSGNEIDRDPIENTIVPDQEAPTLLIKDIDIDLATANVTVLSNEDGTVHYVVKKENDGEPSIREIMQYTGSMGGNKAVSAGEEAIISITDLQDEQSYIFYAVAVDEAGNISLKESEPFEVLDASPPNIEPTQIEGMPGGKRLKISMTPDEPGEYFYYYEELRASGIRQYSSDDILDFVARKDDRESGSDTVSEAGAMDFQIHNLKALTTYVVYIVMKDEHGNMMTEPKVLTGTTKELDDIYPYVMDGKLHPVKDDFYEFEIHVNEPLDPQ
ncbi:MAG: S-layer homology domain-containing protein, partial [Lysinibacillus sp.]